MKLLLLSDVEDSYLWDYFQPGRLDEYDLILSAGDLKAEYLRFLVTMSHAPLLYVHGNHDGNYEKDPPEGCRCIEDQVVKVGGLRILGLGGSVRYNGGSHQYTEGEMRSRIWRRGWALHRMQGVDIVLTHAPPRGCGDGEDYAHRGFGAFYPLLDKWKPAYLIHGHVHLNYGDSAERIHRYGNTLLVNAYKRYVLEVEPEMVHKNGGKKESETAKAPGS